MIVRFEDGAFQCRCTFESRTIPKEAGFLWNPEKLVWYTKDYGVAARLSTYFDIKAKKELAKIHIQIDTWTQPLSIPPGEKLLPFQENAALFALSRNRSYLALDPGLGKTPIAGVIAQTLAVDHGVWCVYICPPFLTRNTEIEIKKWAPDFRAMKLGDDRFTIDFLIVPDSMITKNSTQETIQHFVKLGKNIDQELVLFVDEAHRFKNDDAARTKALFGLRNEKGLMSLFDKVIFLSGTPMPNRPIELYPVLSSAAPQTIHFMNKFEYAKRYCAAYENQWGWDFTGASNMGELTQQVLDTFMLRYRKSEVMKELPLKTEEIVVLNDDMPPKLATLSREILSTLSPDDLLKGHIKIELKTDTLHLSTYRKELGIIKVKAAAQYIESILEESSESILIFAIHKEVIKSLDDALSKYSPLVVTGETRMDLRQAYVEEFQKDPRRRVFIGNIQAAGTGLTLTKATRVVFVEFSWVPADNDQASDRAHRIGQKDNVLVQYLVYEHSVDKAVIETVLRKKKVTEKL